MDPSETFTPLSTGLSSILLSVRTHFSWRTRIWKTIKLVLNFEYEFICTVSCQFAFCTVFYFLPLPQLHQQNRISKKYFVIMYVKMIQGLAKHICFSNAQNIKMALTRETWLCCMQTTKAQTSLRIRAVWSAPLRFASCKTYYLKRVSCRLVWVLFGRKPRRLAFFLLEVFIRTQGSKFELCIYL